MRGETGAIGCGFLVGPLIATPNVISVVQKLGHLIIQDGIFSDNVGV